MANAVKKQNRKLRKIIRKTLGTLFLISAIVVAAIPVENLQADSTTEQLDVTVDIDNCQIPRVDASETIYTTGDGQYQFAYVSPNNASSNNKVAVILGYNGGYLTNGALTIPDTLDAYLKYSDNLGTTSGYAAVGKSGNFLFYESEEPKVDENGNAVTEWVDVLDPTTGLPMLDENGVNLKQEVAVMEKVYLPCYYEDRLKWQDLGVEEFYYDMNGGVGEPSYGKTLMSQHQRIQGAEVWYIGNQYLKAGEGEHSGTWTVAGDVTDSSKGIFAGQGNIRTLTVGEKLSGIGNYAFYGCSGLASIKLGNGLDTIGNYAFANCINMTTVDLDLYSRVDIIGDHAFYNCQALMSFSIPISVTAIGDSAFEGCYAMTSIELCGEGANVSLVQIGKKAFKDCSNLESITFPRTFTNLEAGVDVSMFEGCTSLKFVSTSNNIINFVKGSNPDFGFEEFKAQVPEEFYFEGLSDSPVHKTSTEQNFAFSHLGKDLYEITVIEDGKKAVYRVNSSNQLVYCSIEAGMETVTLPNTIGPYQIQTIESGTFQNKCSLKKITIPSSITSIEADAFKGCHHLQDVIFLEPVNITSIGDGAFKTQEVSFHQDCTNETLDTKPVLRFTGPISYSSVPFTYAMDPANNINYGTQQKTYITYYSGWPTNLEVQYNPDTDKNELTGYPTFKDISSGTVYTTDNYAYMTEEYEEAARVAVQKYNNPDGNDPITDYEMEIINAALNIVLPEGIESIKDNLFVEKEATETVDKTITAYSIKEVAGAQFDENGKEISGGAFKGCKNLTAIYLMDGTISVGDYAFEDCDKLEEAYMPATLTEMGLRPFKDCDTISYVNFQGSPYFACENSIIYELDSAGNKVGVVQVLNGRETGVVDAAELAGVTAIYPEAFAGSNVSSVDFKSSSISAIPVSAFEDTSKLFAVYLPNTCKTISKDAFKNSSISYLEIPGSVSYIDNDAFSGTTSKSGLQFYCEDGSNAYIYAQEQGIKTTSKPIEVYYTVTFWDWDSTLLDTQTIAAGEDAAPPEVPGREGYVHTGWVPDYHGVNSDLQITAQYEAEDPDTHKYTVTFMDADGATVLKTVKVNPGETPEPPVNPSKEGYVFTGWMPALTAVQSDTVYYAQYEEADNQFVVRFMEQDGTVLYTQKVNPGETVMLPMSPVKEGYVFTGWVPDLNGIAIYKDTDTYANYVTSNGGGNGNDNDNDGNNDGNNNGNNNNNGTGSSNNGQTTSKLYTLTVKNGSGSGSYVAGSQPIVIAADPASGQEFSHWTIDPADVTIASKVLTATVITMPEKNVTVTAHYKAKTSNGGSGTTGSSNSSNTNKPNSNSGENSSGTTVVIDKNGLSNTGVVSATVNGSSDNFTIKITESSAAAEAVLKALQAEYGDISDIKYFPMDISLYDSTGKKKITDTKGLSISITLPLPDSMITYAGNNKVAGVVDGKLDKLNAKFNTISGVSCVTFTAEHFSPYVIYVDTDNLVAGTITDTTPKTGDGIHPKWFLSIGLACVAVVLFMKKDRQPMQKVKARA